MRESNRNKILDGVVRLIERLSGSGEVDSGEAELVGAALIVRGTSAVATETRT